MTARILPFPDFFRPASPRDEMGVILVLPVVRFERIGIDLGVEECPKVQELRRQSKRLREYFKANSMPSFSSANSFSGIGSARGTSAMLHPGAVDGSTTNLAGRDSGDSRRDGTFQFSGGTCSGGE